MSRMKLSYLGRAWGAAIMACMVLAGCGGGGGGGGTTATASAAPPVDTTAQRIAQETDASRLAKQATFGATTAVVDRIKTLGVSAWLDEQFAATGSGYADIAASHVATNACPTTDSGMCTRHNFTREPVAMRFYADALSQPDQLRQRVALALSEMVVASTAEVSSASGSAAYNQILLDNAFGNYRTMLLAVTLNGFMGNYLDMADSNKSQPNENYSREMLQLFSMGPNKLNMDGSPVKDSTGATVANYTADDVHNVARALTGWTYAHFNGGTDSTTVDYSAPMVTVAARYDTTAKTFLGVTVAANASQADSVAAVVDAAFNNTSTPPYVARYLIQQLVAANPSAAYVGRVAAVFANNGANVRGDLKAVVRAILTDGEARGTARADDTAGKVKEPILLLTALARAIGMTSDGVPFLARDSALGQPVFQSPSVFNFYPPDFPLPQSTTLVSPASKLLTTGTIVGRSNVLNDWTIGAATTRSEFAVSTTTTGATGSALDWSGWEAFGTDLDGMIDRIDLLFTSRTMTDAQKTALKAAATALTNADPVLQARIRAQVMLYVAASSPSFQVDR